MKFIKQSIASVIFIILLATLFALATACNVESVIDGPQGDYIGWENGTEEVYMIFEGENFTEYYNGPDTTTLIIDGGGIWWIDSFFNMASARRGHQRFHYSHQDLWSSFELYGVTLHDPNITLERYE